MLRRILAFAILLSLCFLSRADEPAGKELLLSVLVRNVPHVQQKPDFCGEACVEMVLRKLGYEITQNDVFNASGLDPALGRGCYAKELVHALAVLGFKPEQSEKIYNSIKADKAGPQLELCFRRLHADLLNGIPSIVCMYYSDQPKAPEHFRLVVGYDAKADELIYMEPAEEKGALRRMKKALFFKLWPLKYSEAEWTAVMIRLEPGPDKIKIPVRTPAKTIKVADIYGKVSDYALPVFTDADYAQEVRKIREKFPKDKLSYCIEKPFVIVGDLSEEELKKYSESTIRWSLASLKKRYFEHDPDRILSIWLLSNAKTFVYYSERITGSKPDTPYGFFSSVNNALIMNIATGGGTLIHEIVHPYMEVNFQGCPSWFNEGMGSLYEQSSQRDGKIIGLTNWRLEGLKQAIREKDLPDFKTLMAYSHVDFYNISKGNNYAQARYLCYYLQEKGLLEKYYKDFVANSKTDPSGYKTLVQVLDIKDMKKFQLEWQDYVMKLKFP